MIKKILAVDDDPDFREAVTTLLESKQYEVITAENGQDGYEKAKQEKPDLILLDVMMTTRKEGFDIAKELQKNKTTSNIPIIIVTGIRKEMNLAFGFEPDETHLPVKTVLEKPVKPESLLEAIRNCDK